MWQLPNLFALNGATEMSANGCKWTIESAENNELH